MQITKQTDMQNCKALEREKKQKTFKQELYWFINIQDVC